MKAVLFAVLALISGFLLLLNLVNGGVILAAAILALLTLIFARAAIRAGAA